MPVVPVRITQAAERAKSLLRGDRVGPFDLLSATFISVAIVITVVSQLPTIWDFVGGKRLNFQSPIITFIGLLSFLILLSSIVALNVVPGSNNVSTANAMAQL